MKISEVSKFLIIFAVALTLGIVGSSLMFQKQLSLLTEDIKNYSQIQPKNEIEASLMIDFFDGKILTCNNQKLTEKRTVFDLLETCSAKKDNSFEFKYELYPEMGTLISKIGEKKNGEEGKYWQFWVNNQYSQVGVSGYQLQNGDIVEWKFMKSQF